MTVCEDCDMEYPGDCPVHGPLIIVEDTKVRMKVSKSNMRSTRQA